MVRARSHIAWMAVRETNTLKPIDSVTRKGNGELSGRNERNAEVASKAQV